MKTKVTTILLFVLFSFYNSSPVRTQERDVIQLAVLLDTSSSMDGLINQAKSQLWKIVNELATAKRNGVTPRLEVALFEYGNDSLPAEENYIRMAVPLTGDLDLVSEELFKLTTNGGSEYCGTVIDKAVSTLNWTQDQGSLKMIVIAGNEPFTQGSINYKSACRSAIRNGIVVNTVFCGDHNEGVRTQWKDGADLADGSYMSIDHNDQLVHIEAPQDKEIAELGKQLNSTYIGYGEEGEKKKERQAAQDINAASVSEEVAVERTVSKSTKQYSNSSWDLIDAVKNDQVEVEELDDDELPDEMKGMTGSEKKEYIESLRRKREEIQEKIQKLNVKRQKYIAEERKKIADTQTLDDAILNSVREQAKKKNYTFE